MKSIRVINAVRDFLFQNGINDPSKLEELLVKIESAEIIEDCLVEDDEEAVIKILKRTKKRRQYASDLNSLPFKLFNLNNGIVPKEFEAISEANKEFHDRLKSLSQEELKELLYFCAKVQADIALKIYSEFRFRNIHLPEKFLKVESSSDLATEALRLQLGKLTEGELIALIVNLNGYIAANAS